MISTDYRYHVTGPIIRINPGELHRTTTNHDLHRLRRDPLRYKFSVAQISKVEDEVHALAQHLGDKFLASRQVFDVQDAMSCLSSDVASLQVFGETFGFVEQQRGFQPNLKRASYAIFTTYFVFRWMQPLKWLFGYGGRWLARFMPEEVAQFQHLNDVEFPRRFQQAKAEHEAGIVKQRQTVLDVLLESDLPEQEKTGYPPCRHGDD